MLQKQTKKEISCKVYLPLFHAANKKNIPLNILLNGIPYDHTLLLNKHEKIEWWVICRLFSNVKPYFTTLEFEEMGKNFVKSKNYIEGYLLAYFIFTSNKAARLFANQFFKIVISLFSCTRPVIEFPDSNKLRVTGYMADGYEFCPEFFIIAKGVWQQLGIQIGQKEFKVELTLRPDCAIFDVSWRKERLFFRFKKGVSWLFNIRKAITEFTDEHEVLLKQYGILEDSKKLLLKQAAQLKTVYEITKTIKQNFNVERTLQAIADALFKEAGFLSAHIKLFKDIEENDLKLEAYTGIVPEDIKPFERSISTEDKIIGKLTIYPNREEDIYETEKLLDYLVPVINISIHDSLVLKIVSDYKNNLELKVSERTFELNKAYNQLSDTIDLLKEAQDAKNLFFTNISHEFRTPLTLILGPVKQILDNVKDFKIKEEARLIYRNAEKLKELINQMLDISRIEAGKMRLKTKKQNLRPIVEEIAASFQSYAERKHISLKDIFEEEEIILYLDREKIDKILCNLLSNAIKFTLEGGTISVETYRKDNTVEISVSDTGIGIPKGEIDKVFDRFYQIESSTSNKNKGTGIGLSLVRDLVVLHKGKITLNSEVGKGSTFTVSLPLGKDHLQASEITEETTQYELSSINNIAQYENPVLYSKITTLLAYPSDIQNKPSLLLIEDNCDVRSYIADILDNDYKINEAIDGEEGLSKAFEQIPDLIISDIMMPKLDGLNLCKSLKTDQRTSHIPLILLTARASQGDRLEGLEIGADDYIIKPFEPSELKIRIKNLIDQRNRIHDHFRKNGLYNLDEKKIYPADYKFLQKTFELINKHIPDYSFNVEMLANKLNMSRSLLHKKLVSLTGEPPIEIIKLVRLFTAAKLIDQKASNISEIALEVGFKNPSYFAECFKKQFGLSPSDYYHRQYQ